VPPCPRCAGAAVKKDGRVDETQRYRCRACHRTFIARTGTPFAGHRWPQEVLVTAVRWSGLFRLAAADVRDLLAERGVDVSARIILYWVRKFAPLLARAGRRAAARPGVRWWCDATYVRAGGKWAYRYHAIDAHGQVVDVLLRTQRDCDSARACFVLAVDRRRRAPEEVSTGTHPAYVRAIRDAVPGATHTQSGLHRKSGPDTTPIARSHVPTRDRPRPMRGLQSIRTGQRAIEGIALARAVQRGHVTVPGAVTDLMGTPYLDQRAGVPACPACWLGARTVDARPPPQGVAHACPPPAPRARHRPCWPSWPPPRAGRHEACQGDPDRRAAGGSAPQ